LKFPFGSPSWTVTNKEAAERLFQFLQWLSGLRNSQHAHIRAWAAVIPPGQLAVAVHRLISEGNSADISDLPDAPNPPIPQTVPPEPGVAGPNAMGTLARLSCAGAVGVLAFLGFPLLDDFLQDEYLYSRIPHQDKGPLTEIEQYLKTCPNGRHADEVKEMKDEFLFARIPTRDDGTLEAVSTMDRYLEALPDGRHADKVKKERDDRYFVRITGGNDTGMEEINRYLERYPDGKHTAEVRQMRDDRVFTKAQRESTARNAPGSLREYLADTGNQKHRAEAQRLIAGFYDRKIAELKEKQAKAAAEDKEVYEVVFSLLESLKFADRPVVTVGFKATIDPEPKTQSQKDIEKYVYDKRVEAKPELKTIAASQPNHSAILSWGKVFEPEQTGRLETVILTRLRDAVGKGISPDILTLEAVPKGEFPMLEVDYHIFAGGRLGFYHKDVGVNGIPKDELIGLLRWYETDWVIVVRSLGEKKETSFRLTSAPAPQLTYDPRSDDPDWAIYAIVVYSSFYDMSARLIRSFGLDPGPTPTFITFSGTMTNKVDEPVNRFPPFNPLLPQPDFKPPFR